MYTFNYRLDDWWYVVAELKIKQKNMHATATDTRAQYIIVWTLSNNILIVLYYYFLLPFVSPLASDIVYNQCLYIGVRAGIVGSTIVNLTGH